VPVGGQLVPVGNHFRDLEGRVNVDKGERHVTEKGFSGKPEHHSAVLPDGPQHAETLESSVSLSQDVYAAVLEVLKVRHPIIQTTAYDSADFPMMNDGVLRDGWLYLSGDPSSFPSGPEFL